MVVAYRIHPYDELVSTVENPERPDGWVAEDEAPDRQPRGISCCGSIGDLASYSRVYGLAPAAGDALVAMTGAWSPDEDRDMGAKRIIVSGYHVICIIPSTAAWDEACEAIGQGALDCSDGDLGDLLEDMMIEAGDPAAVIIQAARKGQL